MNRLCIDLGLTFTGYADHAGSGFAKIPARESLTPMDDAAKQKRIKWWLRRLTGLIVQRNADVVYVEGPFMSREHPNGAIETIKLHGVLATICASKNIPMYTVENKTLKKLATGNGNASKAKMLARANELGCDTDSEDEADAFMLFHVVTEGLLL